MKTGSKPMPTKPEPLSDEMIDEMFPYESILDAPISTELYNTHITKQRRAAKQIRDLLQPRLTALQKRVQELERENEELVENIKDLFRFVDYSKTPTSENQYKIINGFMVSDILLQLNEIIKKKPLPQPPKTK